MRLNSHEFGYDLNSHEFNYEKGEKIAMMPLGLCLTSMCLCGLIIVFPRKTMYVNTLIGIVLTGTALTIILRVELWPFSPYPMFPNVQGSELQRIRLYGIPTDQSLEEFPFIWEYTAPFGEPGMVEALQRLRNSGDKQRLSRAVEDCLDRYERRRQTGVIHGPSLRGIRLYSVEWHLDADAATKDQPTNKELIVELSR